MLADMLAARDEAARLRHELDAYRLNASIRPVSEHVHETLNQHPSIKSFKAWWVVL